MSPLACACRLRVERLKRLLLPTTGCRSCFPPPAAVPAADIVIVIHVVSDAPKGTSFSALWSFISDDGAPDSHIDKVGAHTELVGATVPQP